jgi:hypothetical protein
MKSFNIKATGMSVIICIIFTLNFFNESSKYKEDIGAYDIYTLVILEKKIDNFVEIYHKGEVDKESEEVFRDDIILLSEYLRRSPVLKFMNAPVFKIRDYLAYGYSEKEIAWMSHFQKELRRITRLLHEESDDNIGRVTYHYFQREDNIKVLKSILSEVE